MMGAMTVPGSYSRRAFLGLAAAGAAGAAAGCSASGPKAASAGATGECRGVGRPAAAVR